MDGKSKMRTGVIVGVVVALVVFTLVMGAMSTMNNTGADGVALMVLARLMQALLYLALVALLGAGLVLMLRLFARGRARGPEGDGPVALVSGKKKGHVFVRSSTAALIMGLAIVPFLGVALFMLGTTAGDAGAALLDLGAAPVEMQGRYLRVREVSDQESGAVTRFAVVEITRADGSVKQVEWQADTPAGLMLTGAGVAPGSAFTVTAYPNSMVPVSVRQG